MGRYIPHQVRGKWILLGKRTHSAHQIGSLCGGLLKVHLSLSIAQLDPGSDTVISTHLFLTIPWRLRLILMWSEIFHVKSRRYLFLHCGVSMWVKCLPSRLVKSTRLKHEIITLHPILRLHYWNISIYSSIMISVDAGEEIYISTADIVFSTIDWFLIDETGRLQCSLKISSLVVMATTLFPTLDWVHCRSK